MPVIINPNRKEVLKMTEKQSLLFGTWPSPISASMLSGGLRLNDVQWARGGNTLVWSQSFGGQTTLFARQPDGTTFALTDENNRPSGGIAYGGGEFFAARDRIVFSDRDGRLYSKTYDNAKPQAITPAFGASATPILSNDGNTIIYAHTYEGVDRLAATRADGSGWPVILEQGADFYLNPALSPDDQYLAWIEWNHPNMPWDGTSLKLGRFNTQTLSLSEVQLLDGFGEYACYQACFSPCGNYLAWLANTGELDDLVLYDLKLGKKHSLIRQKGLIQPAWIAGQHTLAWAPDSLALYFIENELGQLRLKIFDLLLQNNPDQAIKNISIGEFTWLDQLSVSEKGDICFIAESYSQPAKIVSLAKTGPSTLLRSQDLPLAPEWFSAPRPFSWQSSDDVKVHGFYYPPNNPQATCEGLPPVIVNVHGGPSAQEYDGFNLGVAYFTSRGYGYFAVNYRGSTGYGKSYRDTLHGNWGKIDLLDTIEGCQALVEAGLADPERLVIMGGSAGGFTVLNALIHYPGFFKLGISRYGVSNLFMLEADTHKFESHYNTSLLGSLPEHETDWHARLPIFHADKIRDALLIFQGSEDKVVPQDQSDSLVEQLRANQVPHLYRVYEGEGHGFRQPENIIDYYETIDRYLQTVLNTTQEGAQ